MPEATKTFAVSLISGALVLGAPSAMADSLKRLTSAEISAKIIGNTLTGAGRSGNCTFFDHFAADGSASARCGGYSDTGQWRMGEDALCIKWSKRPNEYCLVFFSDGTKYQVINPNRGPDPFPLSVIPGRQ
jgi:hypothetical protein